MLTIHVMCVEKGNYTVTIQGVEVQSSPNFLYISTVLKTNL